MSSFLLIPSFVSLSSRTESVWLQYYIAWVFEKNCVAVGVGVLGVVGRKMQLSAVLLSTSQVTMTRGSSAVLPGEGHGYADLSATPPDPPVHS